MSARSGDFNPRSPCGERPHGPSRRPAPQNFNPRSPCGERLAATATMISSMHISIHAPRVGSDRQSCVTVQPQNHFNPRSPCGERREEVIEINQRIKISIHAPRVGSDQLGQAAILGGNIISIHAPRVGSDSSCRTVAGITVKFQSTLPVWGATFPVEGDLTDLCISIHAPRVGSDGDSFSTALRRRAFQSTLPVWGATGRPDPA